MKPRSYFFCLIVCLQGTVIAQDTVFTPALLVTVQGAPAFSYRTISTKDKQLVYLTSSMEAREVMRIGYTAGLHFAYHFSKWMKFEAGLEYADLGFQAKNEELTFGSTDPGLPTSALASTHFVYIDLPLHLQYTFNPRLPMVFVSIGVNGHYLIMEKQVTLYEYADASKSRHTSNGSMEEFKKAAISAYIGLGMYQPLDFDKTWFLKVEPFFNHFLSSATATSVKLRLYHFGMNVGITKMFK